LERAAVCFIHDRQIQEREDTLGLIGSHREDSLTDHLERQVAELLVHVNLLAIFAHTAELALQPLSSTECNGDDEIKNFNTERVGDTLALLPPELTLSSHKAGAKHINERLVRECDVFHEARAL
jgi:hypothetical protein